MEELILAELLLVSLLLLAMIMMPLSMNTVLIYHSIVLIIVTLTSLMPLQVSYNSAGIMITCWLVNSLIILP